MYSYKAYGLCLHSEVELPGLSPGGDSPDLTIRRVRLAPRDSAVSDVDPRRVATGIVEPDLRFYVKDGREIVLDASSTADEDTVRTYLLGLILSTALRQRGLLVLHASCVAKNGRAIVFIGDSGWGKSTLAKLFEQRGYQLFSDDVTAIEVGREGAPMMVLPGAMHIRLRADVGLLLHDDFEALPPVMAGSSKRIYYSEINEQVEPAELSHIYLLEPWAAPANAIDEVPQSQAMLNLVHHTRVHNLLSDRYYTSLNFQQCHRVAREIPVRLLRRKRGLEYLADLVDRIEADLESVCTAG